MLSKNKIGQSFLLLALVIGGFLLAKNVLALDVGVNEISNTIQLGTTDPRTIVARVINVAMMFLGIIAVGIVIFAGFKWMTSKGNEEQIESAKKILKAGVIGLVIVLASWGIAAFILNRLISATGNGGTGGPGGGGPGGGGCVGLGCDDMPCDVNLFSTSCQPDSALCQGSRICNPASCTCQTCSGAGCPGASCNANTGGGVCQDDGSCQAGLICSESDGCTCQANPGGNFGDACDGDLTNNDPNPTCDANNNLCRAGQGLTCDANTCTCLGSPVITAISPVGGFCTGNNNKACSTDGDCTGGTGPCNTNTPNGAWENLISIHGYNFGTSSSGLSSVSFLGNETDPGDDQTALDPSVINPVCTGSWTNNEIIVGIPNNVVSGPIKVLNGNLNSNLIDFDTTNNTTTGPLIPDFIPNTIVRPGICSITPVAGSLGQEVNYYGNNLSGAGFFGNDNNKFKGISSTFNNAHTSGLVLVPNVAAGAMSTFVVNPINQKSNFVSFHKNQEPPVSPSISGFEPETGNIGQYITIRGNGFGNSRGTSQVFLESTEADYNFPTVCLHSVWADNQVIVKVPSGLANGSYLIKMKIGSWEQIASADTFSVNSAATLLPSLCKVEPSRGPVNSPITFYGEYFSSSTNGVARFYNGKDAPGVITNEANTNKLKANVPIDAVTGPVKIVDNSRVGNSLNFMVGSCSRNSECDTGTPYCCPLGSPRQGQCALALMDSNNGCYNKSLTSVFEWKFGTTLYTSCDKDPGTATCEATNQKCSDTTTFCDPSSCTCQPCPANDPNCGIGECGSGGGTCNPNEDNCSTNYTCNPSSCNCVPSFYSCAQKGGGNSCPTGFCPNSPGQCSPYAGGVSQTIGSCQDNCNNILGCSRDTCEYSDTLNKCVKKNITCSQVESFSYTLGVDPYTTSYTTQRTCVGRFWRINATNCPSDWTNIGDGKCELRTVGCTSCSTGFDCNNSGQCVNRSVICATGAVCRGDKCLAQDKATCDCCCDKTQNAADGSNPGCCAPLTCGSTCGAGGNSGKCTGCANAGTTQDQHDAACNCANTSGKYCKADGGSGVCVDCTSLSEGDCVAHSSTCCFDDKGFDDKDGICRGGKGNLVSSNPGHCAFYACASTATNECASSTPFIYSTSSNPLGNYIFKNSNQCSGCTTVDPNRACSALDIDACKGKSGCCWDMGNGTPKCTSGNKIPGGTDQGSCDYYDCQTGLNSDQCIASSTPKISGAYPNWNACFLGCNTPHLGASCNTLATTTNPTSQTCNVSMCGGVAGFSCLTPFGNHINSTTPATSGGCGTCCCDPAHDTCATINSILQCVKDKGNCTGANRGLCCGCQKDSQCGDFSINGCSFDSCCHGRPHVVANNPLVDAQNVCRNSVLSVTFSEKMDNSSLNNNLILLAESPDNNCPAGTYHLALGEENQHLNIFARIYNQIIGSFKRISGRLARLFGSNQAMAYAINPNKTYCATPGITTYETVGQNTILKFSPANVLLADTDYIAVVKGQDNLENLASSTASGKAGVLNSYKIGMAGAGLRNGTPAFGPFGVNGPTFNNSYSWHFKTLDDNSATAGLCLVDHVNLTPTSYIFQKNTNDAINENDISSINPTFDSVADRDKLYSAQALGRNEQELQPVASYDWTWNWTISNPSKINFISGTDLADNGNRRLIGVQTGITDAAVTVTAQTVMNPGNAYTTPNKSKTVNARVFVCLNPWPPVNDIYQWEPSRDTAVYGNYGYEFYYCRDAGDPNTTADDLPAISSGEDIVNLGLSTRSVCSNDRSIECTADAHACDAGGGFCIPDILKESYFFQQ